MSTPQKTIKLYWQHLRNRKAVFALSTILVICAIVAGQFMVPLVGATVLDKLTQNDISKLSLLGDFGPLLLILICLLLAELALWRTQIFIFWTMESKIMKELSERCFSFLMHQTQRFHTNNFGGSLVSQTNKFVGSFERILDEFMFSIVTIITAYIATIVILLPRSPQFVAAFIAISIVYFAVLYWRTKLQHPYNIRESAAESAQTGQMADSITNISTIKPFANEAREEILFEKKSAAVLQRSLASRNIVTINELITNTFTSALYFLALFFGIVAVIRYNANLGTMLLITSYSANLSRRLWDMQKVMRSLTRAFGDAHDMTEMLQMDAEVKDPKNPEKLNIVRGDIRFKSVTYAYPEQPDKPLFNDLNLHIKQGEKVGLVGHSGGGKTSLTKLILRLMDINKGEILIDGHDISKSAQADVRSRIAYVPQEPMMFHRSIAENIRYGRLDATDREIEIVSKMAHADEFIKNLPDGYETLVGERGTKLSGGQRQRIAIARALLKNAPILLLDEATSALDSESESLIQDALWKLMENKTAIVIAHRLSTIQRMDRIIVLENGEIVEEGSHNELLKNDGIYSELWKHQTGGFIED